MNRIILIGNGFDLAHNLPTSYKSFICNFWEDFLVKVEKSSGNKFDNEYITFETDMYNLAHITSGMPYLSSEYSISKLEEQINRFRSSMGRGAKVNLVFKNKFLETISRLSSAKNWVDIENEYYRELIALNSDIRISINDYNIRTLNEEFLIIEKLLEKYLTEIEKNLITKLSINDVILKKIIAPLKFNDISYSSANLFIEEIIDKSKFIKLPFSHNDSFFDIYREKYKFLDFNYNDILNFTGRIWAEDSEYDNVMKEIEYNSIPHFFTVPEDILFLNFNYTHTIDKYIDNKDFYKTINIHGELNNKTNPIIFGYGDELEHSYKSIENINENDYLKNVKSIRYLETDNYRRLLNFIESAPFQIFIMGHSCGNSDRTLLNTLFEHKNCISIKPFYHQRNEMEDNYSDIVRNISRNFTDKALMRDRVVNKMYCEPLV
ncbi:AbiH family protein [Dysgonomonas sp. 37-18]|uniref:AbiH family protein n=1 Tax=Dysgonomonas sp. 37-18 TaxID=1895907 RepID=UPI00092C5872|nr:AbiH family protein [Dysgonomonas sp. 37-18]OJX64270.1 MAG: hypothetical protein BGO84_09405 [Dysgonomonas sp. 37-18]